MSKPIERIEIITGRERRRRYSAGEKVRLVERVRGDIANMGRQFNNVLLVPDTTIPPALRQSIADIATAAAANLVEADRVAPAAFKAEIARALA
jgi:hypothetical protein